MDPYNNQPANTPRKELRNSDAEWRGMTSAQRQAMNIQRAGTKKLMVTTVLKIWAVIIVMVIIGKLLFDTHQECLNQNGNSIVCVD